MLEPDGLWCKHDAAICFVLVTLCEKEADQVMTKMGINVREFLKEKLLAIQDKLYRWTSKRACLLHARRLERLKTRSSCSISSGEVDSGDHGRG